MDETGKLMGGNLEELTFGEFRESVLNDYRIACESRAVSVMGRKEVLTGKAKFGIFGDGKEVPQIALAKSFKPGDFRSGYYRDQTFMFASGEATILQYFSQLYANPDIKTDPHSGGRQMNAHFATRSLDENGEWKNLLEIKNSSADGSSTGHQMPRAVGLALASKIYRASEELNDTKFSNNGDEVVFCTIGDASTSEGVFWEALNAAGVLKIPLAISVWDDGYGISVPKEKQTTKGSISEILQGFQTNDNGDGVDIYEVNGWDYPALCETYEYGIKKIRKTHIPALFHIKELTQPTGHSTSGSHERYKSKKRLAWERKYDCIKKMREWIIESAISGEDELDKIETEATGKVRDLKNKAWKQFTDPVNKEIEEVCNLYNALVKESRYASEIVQARNDLTSVLNPLRKDIVKSVKRVLRITRLESTSMQESLLEKMEQLNAENEENYASYLHSRSRESALNVKEIKPEYQEDAPVLNGFEILNRCFDENLRRDPRIFAFGEDVGKIGDVNQGFAGLQDKYGELRVFDTGIREATIIGQGIGMAMRGLRPIAEIQYLDYLIYGLQPLTDDLATLHYRTKGGQKAPLIVRTRGHRLEGIWHTGSPIGMIINSLRGMYVLVPRDMTRAAGFYNTMLQSDDPALIIECLNGYRLKETLPSNMGEFTVPLGMPEVIEKGEDVTIVTYGSCIRIAQEAARLLREIDISCELIDVQTLLPFDLKHRIVESVKKTSKVLFLDEDVPGGATAFMYQQVLEGQRAYYYLDCEPKTLSALPSRAAYGSDGDYFCKPNPEDVFEAVYEMMHDDDPGRYPMFY